jgi:WD40-like Beta Propeller Repeat
MLAHRLRLVGVLVWSCALLGSLAFGAVGARAAVKHEFLSGVSAKLNEGVPSTGPHGEPVPVPGVFSGPRSMTVDGGELFVAEGSETARIDRFDAASGAFLGQFPQLSSPLYLDQGVTVGHSTGEAQLYVGGDVYPAGSPKGSVAVLDPATGGVLGVWTGADTPAKGFGCFECGGSGSIAVDANPSSLNDWAAGYVYVADPLTGVVDVFKPLAGGGEKYVTQLQGPEPPGVVFTKPVSVAVNPSNGEVFVADGSVDVFRPSAIVGQYEFAGKLTWPTSSPIEFITDVAVDGGNGDIYISNNIYTSSGLFVSGVVDQFDASGKYVGRLTGTPNGSSGEVNLFGSVQSVAVDPVSHDVYVGSSQEQERRGFVDVFGPGLVVPDVTTGAVTGAKAAGDGTIEATLNGTVNPDGEGEASCWFVWGTTKEFGQEARCEPEKVANGGSPVGVHVTLHGLAPDTVYYYRLQASNKNGTNSGESGQDVQFTTPGPGLLDESASDVASSSATLDATIDPHGSPTSYYFQYGTSAEYGSLASGAPLGSGEQALEVGQHVQGLQASTVYHYRVVAVSELGSGGPEAFFGPDRTFTTQAVGGGGSVLLDGRSWEMLSPADKHGATIAPINEVTLSQAAAGGDVMSYVTFSPIEAEPHGNALASQVLATRGPGGWVSRDIALPYEAATGPSVGKGYEYRLFTEDLSSAVVQPAGGFIPASSPLALSPNEASEQTAFLRTDYLHGSVGDPCVASCYRPLVTGMPGYANVPPGAVFGEEGLCPPITFCGPRFVGASPDLSHVVLTSEAPLTPGANKGALYEWAAGRLALVSVLPESEEPAPAPQLGFGDVIARHAVSDDGSRIFWDQYLGHLYLRDLSRGAKGETVQVDVLQGGSGLGSVGPVFQIASSDGSRVFFADEQRLTKDAQGFGETSDLYECEIVEVAGKLQCKLSDLTPGAGVVGDVLGASRDGSWVYFVSKGVLAQGAVSGADNLYVRHGGSTRLVAALSGEDSPDWGVSLSPTGELGRLTARVSPDGEWLAFMSQRSLTGYNTRDVVSGKPDEEVYLYHGAGAGSLVCASCDPTGARPVGVEYKTINDQLVGGDRVWRGKQWIAANIPGWTSYKTGSALYQSRYLSDEGRLFFNSSDVLVPQDVNGGEDVYEFEPPGVGGCAVGGAGFSERSGGCVGLVSSGGAAGESAFLDASESGGDVFFLTAGKLASQDFDASIDLYDAHECSSVAPCFAPPAVVPPPCVTGDSCKPAPVPQPSVFGSPASATFSGQGNVAQALSRPVVGQRGLTGAQKLKRALRACHHRKGKRRKACERAAHRRYGSAASSSSSRTASVVKRGRG